MFEVRVEAGFEAGHSRGPAGEPRRLHHHSWQVAARARSRELDHIGIVVDFRVLRDAIDEVIADLDQRVLEEVDGFGDVEPTVPAVAEWIFARLERRLQAATGLVDGTEPDGNHEYWLAAVEVEADPGARFEYRPPESS